MKAKISTIALVAHDQKKEEMATFVANHEKAFAKYTLFATGTTGLRVMEHCPSLKITRLKSGPLGGDQQIGAMIAEQKIDALVFFVDPLSPLPHDVDVKALTRIAEVYDLPMALTPATAEFMMVGFAAAKADE